jgi:predicted permease
VSVWRQIWADVVHEWHRAGFWGRLVLPLTLLGACVRAVFALVFDPTPWRGLGNDLRYAWRRLLRTPVYLIFGVGTIAVVMTVLPTAHAVLAYFLWQPSQIIEPNRVVQLRTGSVGNPDGLQTSWADWLDFESTQTSFSAVAASYRHRSAARTSAGSARLNGAVVSPQYFDVHLAPMYLGRPLGAADFGADAAPAIVLSERVAARLFGAASAAIDRQFDLGGRTFTIVGIARAGYVGGGNSLLPPDYWIAIEQARQLTPPLPAGLFDLTRRQVTWLEVQGRLRSGVSLEQANSEAARVGTSLEERYRSVPLLASQPAGAAQRRWSATPATVRELELFRPMGLALLGGLFLVLMLACTNLANLALSRGAWRQHDLDVRRALGASRWRLVREEAMDTAIIVGLAGALAALATGWLVNVLAIEIPIARGVMVWMEPELTPAVIVSTAAAAGLCLLVAGIWPALRSSRSLTVSGRHGRSRVQMRLQRVLVGVQVVGSVSLLMLTSSVIDATTRRLPSPGVDLARLGFATLDLANASAAPSDQIALREQLLAKVAGLPGVQSAAVSDALPFGQFINQMSVRPSAESSGPQSIGSYAIRATPGFWTTLDIPLLAGRALTIDDERERRDVGVVSAIVARELFGSDQVVGRRVWYSERSGRDTRSGTFEIVGVAADTDTFTMGSRRQGLVVRPFVDDVPFTLTVSARAIDADTAVAAARAAVRDVDRDLLVSTAATGWSGLSGPYYFMSVLGWLSAAVGGLTLALVMAGLYGVLATVVAHARREMAIRIALGSTAAQLARRVIALGTRPVVAGLLLGVALGTVFRFGVRAVLPAFRLEQLVDPVGLLTVPLLVGLATLIATWLPARRAAKVDPNIVLRQE